MFSQRKRTEYRVSCIECMLCVNTCHVMREHQKFDEFAGPRFFVRLASLEMHPLDERSRIPEIKDDFGIVTAILQNVVWKSVQLELILPITQ